MFTFASTSIQVLIKQRLVLALISLLVMVALWDALTRLSRLPAFILPTPLMVFLRFYAVLKDGSLFWHSLITLYEVMVGLLIGVTMASVLGYLLAKSPIFERLLAPYIVATQSIPMVAIAPLLIIWFGSGLLSKVLVCSLIVFFPVLINTILGVRSIPEDLYDLMRSLQASRWQTFYLMEVPASLSVFFGGLRVGATLSVIGAVVGELVGSDQGLGFLINVARGQYDTALVFVAVVTLITMAMALYGVVVLGENRLLSWQVRNSEKIVKNQAERNHS